MTHHLGTLDDPDERREGAATGFPPGIAGDALPDIGAKKLQLDTDFTTPIAVLHAEALAHNLATMADWCAARGAQLQPHGKTTMSPQLFQRQIDHGATGITAATVGQVRTMRQFGFNRIQLANQLVQASEADWVAREIAATRDFHFTCWVDSLAGVQVLERAAERHAVRFDVLLEFGAPGGRAGCRGASAAVDLANRIADSTGTRLIGLSGYEGSVAGDRSAASLRAVTDYLRNLRDLADHLFSQGYFLRCPEPVITAGGSMFFDLVVSTCANHDAKRFTLVLRSGCYIAHDHGLFARNTPLTSPPDAFRAALTVWGTVLSVQGGVAFIDVGRRHISYDQGMPVPLRRRRPGVPDRNLSALAITALNDQHGYLPLTGDVDLLVGDRVELGVSHPCTTFDKWRLIPIVDRSGTVVDTITTYF